MPFDNNIKLVLRYLADNPASVNEEEVKRYLKKKLKLDDAGFEKEFKRLKEHLKEGGKDGFIGTGDSSGGEVWNIYPKGFEYLHTLERDSLTKDDLRHNKISTLAYVVLTIVIIFTTMKQCDISEKTLEEDKKLTEAEIAAKPPINPRIVIIPENNFGEIFPQRLVSWDASEDKKQTTSVAVFIIKNTGLFDTGKLTFSLYGNEWFYSSEISINNLEGMSAANRTPLQFFLKCSERNASCNYTAVPNGTHEMTISINCDYCEPSFFYKNISVCVLRSSYSECNNKVH